MKMDLDETIEQIMEIFKQETDWEKYRLVIALKRHRFDEEESIILNIEGTLRERLKTLLSVVKEEAHEEGERQADEHRDTAREPAFDPHELD